MTQEELSKRSGISRTTISALENGTQRATSTKTLLKIAKALGKSVDQIFLAAVFNQLDKTLGEQNGQQTFMVGLCY